MLGVVTQTTPGSGPGSESDGPIAVGGYGVCKAVYTFKMKTILHSCTCMLNK